MDIIDPALESSVRRESEDVSKFKPIFFQILILIAVAFVTWIAYSAYSSRLDTRPENTIDINPDLRAPSGNSGRQAPISETI